MRRGMTRSVRRFPARRATSNLQWSDVSAEWVFAAQAVTAAVVLIQLQSPAALSNLTADPPEDLTILRMVGDFSVTLAGSAVGIWTLALTVADVTWTPGATMRVDGDKRILWSRQYWATNATSDTWQPPGTFNAGGAGATPYGVSSKDESPHHVDITPRVKVEAGKALYLVAYEEVNGATLTVSSRSLRVLYKRSGRR